MRPSGVDRSNAKLLIVITDTRQDQGSYCVNRAETLKFDASSFENASDTAST